MMFSCQRTVPCFFLLFGMLISIAEVNATQYTSGKVLRPAHESVPAGGDLTPYVGVPLVWVESTLPASFGLPSGLDGRYKILSYLPMCPGSGFSMNYRTAAWLKYSNFDPRRSAFAGRYPVISENQTISCSGGIGLSFGFFGLGIVQSQLTFEPSSWDAKANVNLIIDVRAMDGWASLVNTDAQVHAATSSPAIPDVVPVGGVTTYDQYSGLVTSISEEDAKYTDIYIFRTTAMGEDELIAEVEGANTFSLTPDKRLHFNVKIRGPEASGYDAFNNNSAAGTDTVSTWENSNKNSAAGGYLRQKDFLRVGDKVKVILINRPTGYLGVQEITVGDLPLGGSIL